MGWAVVHTCANHNCCAYDYNDTGYHDYHTGYHDYNDYCAADYCAADDCSADHDRCVARSARRVACSGRA
jgi:hypothetical protein